MTIGSGISLKGIHHEDAQYPFGVYGTIVTADLGKAVSLYASADTTVQLAADGAAILGQLMSYEDRTVEGIKVGTVSTAGGLEFKIAAAVLGGASEPAVGDTIVGAGSGEVKKGTGNWLVVSKRTSGSDKYVTVIRA